MFTRLVVLTVLILAAFALTAFQVSSPPETLCEFLALVGTVAGIQAAVGVLISILVEQWSGWKDLPPKSKRPIILGMCLGVPLLSLFGSIAACGAQLTPDALYWAIALGCIAYTTADFAHIRKLPAKKRVEPSE